MLDRTELKRDFLIIMTIPLIPEFSRPVNVAKLGGKLPSYRIEASDAERAALALRFNLISLDRLVAEITLRREPKGAVRLDGRLEADLVQHCVATLEPVPEEVVDEFVLIYRPDLDEAAADRLALENPEDEIVEPLIGESIDIGEAVAQQLAVVMEPFPRAADAVALLPEDEDIDDISADRPSPFDLLAKFKS
jgi:uncharacterized metal-binding protein YceD (DUF177 family)